MIAVFTAFSVSLLTVGIKITQQQNVNHGRRAFAVACSFTMAALDVGLIGLIAHNSWNMVLPVGTGGALVVSCP